MFETLRTTRFISRLVKLKYGRFTVIFSFISKAVSYAIWHPDIVRTEVTVARGIHFGNMGHSAPQSIAGEDGVTKAYKRLELLPEEAIYPIDLERSQLCWHKRRGLGIFSMRVRVRRQLRCDILISDSKNLMVPATNGWVL